MAKTFVPFFKNDPDGYLVYDDKGQLLNEQMYDLKTAELLDRVACLLGVTVTIFAVRSTNLQPSEGGA